MKTNTEYLIEYNKGGTFAYVKNIDEILELVDKYGTEDLAVYRIDYTNDQLVVHQIS